jgi:hypothetical protein
MSEVMNFILFLSEKELVTPPLDGLILPGITRASILELSREWNEFRVSERSIPMAEVVHLLSESRVGLLSHIIALYSVLRHDITIERINKYEGYSR